jgi:hypothetical protein
VGEFEFSVFWGCGRWLAWEGGTFMCFFRVLLGGTFSTKLDRFCGT